MIYAKASLILLVAFSFSALAQTAAKPSNLPSQTEVERELAEFYRKDAVDVLKTMDPKGTYDALVKVSLDARANWDQIATLNEEEFLPGTLKTETKNQGEMRRRIEEGLSQKREFLIITPAEVSGDVQRSAVYWIGRRFNLAKDEPVRFQHQSEFKEPESMRVYWLAAIAAAGFILAIAILGMLIYLSRRPVEANQEKPAQKNEHKHAAEPPPPKMEAAPEKAASQVIELPSATSVDDLLAAIRRVSSSNTEIASLAFANLINRTDLIETTANVISAIGMDTALQLYPKVSSAAWTRLGDAMTQNQGGEVSVDECHNFVRALNAEIARMQHHANTLKLLPNLEAKGSGEILSRIRGAGPNRGATLMAMLSEVAIAEVAPKISAKELAPLLGKMLGISAVPMAEVNKFDRDEALVDVNNQNISIEAVAKCAKALSALSASDEFSMFDTLLRGSGGGLLGAIAPYRLYPQHIRSLPREVVSQAMQGRDLDELRQLIQGAKGDLRGYLMQFVGDRQREALDDSVLEFGDGSAALRSLLVDLQERLGQSYGSGDIQNLFRNERAA